MTLDVMHGVKIATYHDWAREYEAFCVCRNCFTSTVYILRQRDYDFARSTAGKGVQEYNGSLNPFFEEPKRYICIRDIGTKAAPEFVPEPVERSFNQGATALAVECYDAAGAMFRKALDLATVPLLPDAESGTPNKKIRRDLGLRLPWLLDNGLLPSDLRELSTCIREDGNDGAHAGELSPADAADLLDFTEALLERLYTEPERLKLAKQRREARRQKPDG